VGKTELSLALAERAGAEIVSMDSMLVYRGMDIGTAKPGAAERARAPHHLMDLVEPDERFSVQQWLAEAERTFADIRARGRRALVVGGTAFFLRALVYGLFDGPPVDADLRAAIQARADQLGPEALHAELARVDARSAERLHPNDVKRVVRALEVWEQSGRPLSDWQTSWGWHGAGTPAARACRIVGLRLETERLDAGIRARTADMLARGWLEEAVAIRAGPGFGPTASQALGYTEVLRLADGELERTDCETLIALRTRQFARRQRTWLRRFDGVHWIDRGQEKSPVEELDEALIALGWGG
jgi:tRNA dimethylallyltransferase